MGLLEVKMEADAVVAGFMSTGRRVDRLAGNQEVR